MIRVLFSLRFKSQLRRTRPELIGGLEKFIVRNIEAAGGIPGNEHRLLTASFDENALGIWLDILILIEGTLKALNEAAADLYGYTLVIGRDIPEEEGEGLCRRLAGGELRIEGPAAGLPEGDGRLPGESTIGVWCDPTVQQALGYYVYFEKPRIGQADKSDEPAGEYLRFAGIKSFSKLYSNAYPMRETIVKALGQGKSRNMLLLGAPYSGKRDGLYRHCAELLGETPPLIVRFGAGGRFLSPLADAYSSKVREFIVNSGAALEILQELDRLDGALFRDRLRSEISGFMARTAFRFFLLLLETYAEAMAKVNLSPVLVLENIHRAENGVAQLFMDIWTALPGRKNLLVFGTADIGPDSIGGAVPAEERIKDWDQIFPRVLRLEAGNQAALLPEMSRDLWEILYALHLLGRYFPGALLSSLLEEEGKNPVMISRALEMLGCLGVVDLLDDPLPRIRNCHIRAERVLGERKEKAQALVRNRLLAWVNSRRISPCFALLEAFADLGNNWGGMSRAQGDELVLKGISSDLVNGTYARIEQVIKAGNLEKIIGSERVFTVLYLFRTYKALLHGDEGEIRDVFAALPAADQMYPAYKAQVLVNVTAWHLGSRDVASALETVKEAVLLSQERSWSGLAQSYRLFALVNLLKQQTGETVDYVTFAVENAEKTGNVDELGVSSYYAAVAQYLFGNLSKAERLIAQAEIQSAEAGRSEWTDRARFLRGKLAFDLGRYPDARSIFEDILKNPAGLMSPAKEGLLDAWVYRALVYIENPLIDKPQGGGPDADLFEIEASYLAGDFGRTIELSDRLAAAVPQDSFLYTEQPDWRSGFAQCELLLLPQREFWDRMISAYHSLALCRVSKAGGEAAAQNMQRILRDERLSEMDPNDAFYFYAWYRVLEESRSPQVDMNTAVSMAFKRLQRRASRIDDVEIRRAYLSQPRWNNALSLAAKEYKLI
ncbi:hypothetical protein FACS189479_00500 [Spirochaetia bacterium]|nr:hypothetical protein FACS189479_00500 [Spirochaetia bacterium]